MLDVAAEGRMTEPRDIIIALIGTRRRIVEVNADITSTMEGIDRDTIIATGDASGVDCHVRRECDRLGFRKVVFHVRKINGEWASDYSGPERNILIARFAQQVIAWPATPETERQWSKGSWGCIDLFRQRNKPVDVRDVAWRTR